MLYSSKRDTEDAVRHPTIQRADAETSQRSRIRNTPDTIILLNGLPGDVGNLIPLRAIQLALL